MTNVVPLRPVNELKPGHVWCTACMGNGFYTYTEHRPAYGIDSPVPDYVKVVCTATCAECHATGQVLEEEQSSWR